MNSIDNKEVVKKYFNAFTSGDMQTVLDSFHENCKIISVRETPRETSQLHGVYNGKIEAKQFLENIGSLFTTEEFKVENIIGEGNLIYANGNFLHRIKVTNKLFASDWVQRCIIEDGKIKEYRFYEDSAAFEVANKF